jgi:pimeloyl-ACP methyl ester carboxylesterase
MDDRCERMHHVTTREPTFVLIPGAGGSSFTFHRLVSELERRGRTAIAVDLPAGDDRAGFDAYAAAVVAAIGDRARPVLVANSLAGFTAPRVCERVPVELVVLLNAMIPRPGETAGAWWGATGHAEARAEQAARDGRVLDDADVIGDFFHDVPPEVTAEVMAQGELSQSATVFEDPPLDTPWPDVPTRVLVGRDDRFFPAAFQRRVAQERLGITPDELPGGHLVALSRPRELADWLERYWAEIGGDVDTGAAGRG